MMQYNNCVVTLTFFVDYARVFFYYAPLCLFALTFYYALCSKLCQHNSPRLTTIQGRLLFQRPHGTSFLTRGNYNCCIYIQRKNDYRWFSEFTISSAIIAFHVYRYSYRYS